MPFHKAGGYDGFDSLAEARRHYKRCRTMKGFILSNAGVEKDKPECAVCHKQIGTANGNRCEYFPKRKKLVAMHYECAWKDLFGRIARMNAN